MRRLLTVFLVVAVMAAMVAVMAVPAFADKGGGGTCKEGFINCRGGFGNDPGSPGAGGSGGTLIVPVFGTGTPYTQTGGGGSKGGGGGGRCTGTTGGGITCNGTLG